MRTRGRRGLAGCVCAAAVIWPSSGGAAWTTEPWMDMQAEYYDNIRLIPDRSEDVVGGLLGAGVQVRRVDERHSLRLVPSLRLTRYDSDEDLDSNDKSIKGEWRSSGERSAWELDGEWTQDSTLTSELEVSGLVQARKQRDKRFISPSYNYVVNARNTLGVGLAHTQVDYADAEFTGLVDYDYSSADLSWAHQWSERIQLIGAVFAARLHVVQFDNEIDTSGAQLLLNAAFNQRWDGRFSAGLRRTEGQGVSGQEDQGWLADVRLVNKDELGRWQLGLSRSVDPSGTGVLVQRDQLLVSREQNLGPKWRAAVSAHWSENQDLQSLAVRRDREYRTASFRLSRLLTPTWSVDARYSYAWQQYAGTTNQAERNAFFLGVHYNAALLAE